MSLLNTNFFRNPTREQLITETDDMNVVNNYLIAKNRYDKNMDDGEDMRQLERQCKLMDRKPMGSLKFTIPSESSLYHDDGIPQGAQACTAHIAKNSGWPFNAVLLVLISAVVSAMCGRYIVQVTKEWVEAVVLYTLLIAESGCKKSYVYKKSNEPHRQFQEKLLAEFDPNAIRMKQEMFNFAKRIKVKDIIKNTAIGEYCENIGELMSSLGTAFTELDKYNPKVKNLRPPLFLMDKFTRKGLTAQMQACGGGVTITQSEGIGLINEFTGKKANLDIFLKAYGMESYASHSKIDESYLSKPFLNILLFAQPNTAVPLFANRNLLGSGLTARFISYFVGKIYKPRTFGDDTNSQLYFQKLTRMLERNFTTAPNREVFTIKLTPGAQEMAQAFQQHLTGERYPNDAGDLSAFASKLAGTAVRYAGALHAWEHEKPENTPIAKRTMDVAIRIAEHCLLPHAEYAFSPSGFRASQDAQIILTWVKRHGSSCFDSREVSQGTTVKTVDKIFPALDFLERCNILTQLVVPNKPRLCAIHNDFFRNG